MQIQTLASGSKGNCYKISDGETVLLLECGIPIREIKRKLNFDMDIDACLITHEHDDHSHGAKDLMRAGIDCYMTSGTAEALSLTRGHRLHRISPIGEFTVGTFEITTFDVKHDAIMPVGYILKSTITGETVLFVTDTMYVKYQFHYPFDYIMIECNFITELLNQNLSGGVVDRSLRDRILKNHFSLEAVVSFLEKLNLSRCKQIYLLHLSSLNSDENIMKETVQKTTGKAVMIC